MRQDLNKVMGECYRAGRGIQPKLRPTRDPELLPTRESMKQPYRQSGWRCEKSSTVNLAQVQRWLEKQVGRKWNDVYSDLCRTFDRRSFTNHHLIRYILDRVTIRGLHADEEGVVWETPDYGHCREVDGLFVHPVTGIFTKAKVDVCYTTYWRRINAERKREREQNRRVISKTQQLQKHQGIWYLVELAPVRAPQYVTVLRQDRRGVFANQQEVVPESICVDALTGHHFTQDNCTWYEELNGLYGDGSLYAISKRQVSHRELKRHGVLNTPPALQ